MMAQLKSFFTQKAGNAVSEYEDACWLPECRDGESTSMRLAVADGATETSFAGLWATLLVRAYGRRCLTFTDPSMDLDRCRRVWRRIVTRKPLPWYAEEKLRLGAFSSLLGLTVIGSHSVGTWEALSVGDSCLFHLRGEDLLASFPIDHSEGFTSRPSLLSSVGDPAFLDEGLFGRLIGRWRSGDTFYLMTDALARWFLKRWELGADPLELLRAMDVQEEFEGWISRERHDLAIDGTPFLKNDDVTLLTCHML